ncbi:MAG: hypothetical protein IRZ07_11435, partial [Microbispora sp.]|nr:hypothetical protein [Microbispora sp.]
MRRRLTAALLLLLHAIFLTSGPVPVWGTPQRAAVLHTGGLHLAASPPPAGAGTVRQAAGAQSPAHHGARPADLRICAPAHATRQARG